MPQVASHSPPRSAEGELASLRGALAGAAPADASSVRVYKTKETTMFLRRLRSPLNRTPARISPGGLDNGNRYQSGAELLDEGMWRSSDWPWLPCKFPTLGCSDERGRMMLIPFQMYCSFPARNFRGRPVCSDVLPATSNSAPAWEARRWDSGGPRKALKSSSSRPSRRNAAAYAEPPQHTHHAISSGAG